MAGEDTGPLPSDLYVTWVPTRTPHFRKGCLPQLRLGNVLSTDGGGGGRRETHWSFNKPTHSLALISHPERNRLTTSNVICIHPVSPNFTTKDTDYPLWNNYQFHLYKPFFKTMLFPQNHLTIRRHNSYCIFKACPREQTRNLISIMQPLFFFSRDHLWPKFLWIHHIEILYPH